MAAGPAGWLRPALGLRLLLATAFQANNPSFGAYLSCMQELSLKSVDENWGGSLKSKYVRGSDPVLKLLDDNGNIAEELSILKWNTDSVEEFLSEKLERL
ncbi:hypothetical protein STEG23_020859 [Scotinomys teguina]